MSYTFTISKSDERYKFTEGKYEKEYENSYETIYYVSEFLQNKLNKYMNVCDIYYYPVWIIDNKLVIKLYFDPQLFEKALYHQQLLSKEGIGCKIIETWINNDERFIISEYGGRDLSYYTDDIVEFTGIPSNLIKQIDSIVEKLQIMGLKISDYHAGNFVEDDQGKIRLIDYESIDTI
jgi:hypothetical protein